MRQCKYCGKDMTIEFGNRKSFCNDECYKKFYGVKKAKLVACEMCGKPLTGQRRTYCSDECQKKSKQSERYDEYKKPQATTYPVIVKKRGRPKKSTTLAGINELARAEGLTYGQYVGKYGL